MVEKKMEATIEGLGLRIRGITIGHINPPIMENQMDKKWNMKWTRGFSSWILKL